MTLSQIDYFLSVSETLSVSATAKKMFVSQSAVSKQIILLEKGLGVLLFNRNGNNLELTENGGRFRACLQRCAADFQETLRAMAWEGSTQRSLSFTASINIGQTLLEIAAELRSRRALQLIIEALNYQNQISPKADIIITYEDVKLPAHMRSFPLFDVQKYIAYSRDDPYREKADLCAADFNRRMMFAGAERRENYRQQMALCKRLGITPQVSFRGNIASLLFATITEQGFCIIDDLCREIHTPGLALFPIEESVRIVIAYSETASPHISAAAEEIAALLRRWFEQNYGRTAPQKERTATVKTPQ